MSFDVTKWNKRRYLAEANLLESPQENLAKEIIQVIPENLGYKDFALAVAIILKDEYGSHNFDKFMEVLHAELGMNESLNEAEMITYKVKITTSIPRDGGPDEDFYEEVKIDASLSGDKLKEAIEDAVFDMGYRRLYKLTYEKA